jgi:hypothetical protein
MKGWRTPSSSSIFFKLPLVLRLVPTSSSCVFEPLLARVFFKLLRAFFLSRLRSNSSNILFLKFEEQLLWSFFFLFVLFWRKNQLKLFFLFLFLSFAVWIFWGPDSEPGPRSCVVVVACFLFFSFGWGSSILFGAFLCRGFSFSSSDYSYSVSGGFEGRTHQLLLCVLSSLIVM